MNAGNVPWGTMPGEPPLDRIPFLKLAGPDIFDRRARRLRHLAEDHPLKEYLGFLAYVAEAQQEVLNRLPALPQPGDTAAAHCRDRGRPLRDARTWQRHPLWREGLDMILERIAGTSLPPAARDTVKSLMKASDTLREELADRILTGDLEEVSPRELPLVAATLQAYWVHLASHLKGDGVTRPAEGGSCPVCGSPPTVGIIGSGGAGQGLRYLHCSLCASQWHLVRLTCSSCGSTQGISYFVLEGTTGAAKAECCDDCHTYLKLLYLEKDPVIDAMADDLATLPLDLLMTEKGKVRRGPNLYFHPGVA